MRRDATGWLADLYGRHFGAVYRVCRSLLWSSDDAADAAHDVFAIAARGGVPLDSEAHSRAWLLSVARRRSIDLLRKRRRLADALARVGEPAAPRDPEGLTIDRSMVSIVLARLRPRERRLLWQSAVERRPIRDIAQGLQLSYMSTAQALRRARRRAAAIASSVAVVLATLRPRRLVLSAPGAGRLLVLALLPATVIVGQIAVQARPTPGNPPSAGRLAARTAAGYAASSPIRRPAAMPPRASLVPVAPSVPATANSIPSLPGDLPLPPLHSAAVTRALRSELITIMQSHGLPSLPPPQPSPSSNSLLPSASSLPH